MQQLNLKQLERASNQDNMMDYYRKLEDKEEEIQKLSNRLKLRENYTEEADKT